VLARHLDPKAPLVGSIVASGLCAWAAAVTPAQTGGGPVLIYTLKRYGTPVPEAVIATFMNFVATIMFFSIAGPVAIYFGAGRALERHGILGQTFTLFDLFSLSLSAFVIAGIIIVTVFVSPGFVRRVVQSAATWFETHGSPRLAAVAGRVKEGVNRAHDGMKAFLNARGWRTLAVSVVLSAPAYAPKLLAGYCVLRMMGIEVNFVDVLLLQTLITFLLYFAPTPGGSGLAELISAAVMSIYVPRALTPSYILLWRIVGSYLTVVVGSMVFWRWLKLAEGRDNALEEGAVSI
jgi:uncharacterized protein (TIRG00374 family)